MVRLLVLASCLSLWLGGCASLTGTRIQRDLEVALALRQVVIFSEADQVARVVVNDNRAGHEDVPNLTVDDTEEVAAIVNFLNDREAAWKPYRGKNLRRPVGITLDYREGFQYVGTGDGYLHTRMNGSQWYRELSYPQQERLLELLGVDRVTAVEEDAEDEPSVDGEKATDPPAESPSKDET